MGLALTITGDAPTLQDMADQLELADVTERFEGALEYQARPEPGDPPTTWSLIGGRGVCSPVLLLASIRFLLADPRVVKVRVLKLGPAQRST